MPLYGFSLSLSEMRRDTLAKRVAAAKSKEPDVHRLAVVVSEMLAAYRVTDPNDEHRLTAKELGAGGMLRGVDHA